MFTYCAIHNHSLPRCSLLCDTKRGCLQQQDVLNPSDSAICKAVNKELSRHCRRTRGADDTYKAIEDLLLQFTPATDSLGVPVFRYTSAAQQPHMRVFNLQLAYSVSSKSCYTVDPWSIYCITLFANQQAERVHLWQEAVSPPPHTYSV